MITYSQIQRIAAKEEVFEEVIEKDFLIELLLYYFAKDLYLRNNLVFRGGTALKKMYFSTYRYSEDLDFLVNEKYSLDEYEKNINKIFTKISSDYPFHLDQRREYNNGRLQLFVLYDIITEIQVTKELKIDIVQDTYIPEHNKKKIVFTFDEFKNKNNMIRTYTLESIISDKIGRILDIDNEPRDIFDLYYLMKQKINTHKVRGEFSKKWGYNFDLHNLLREFKKQDYIKTWKIRLEKQIRNLPQYEQILEELNKILKQKFR